MSTIAIDVGGTHTDLYGRLEDIADLRAKVPTTSDDPTIGVMNALEQASVDLAEVDAFMHGSTIATNAVIERTYPETPFITTNGFRDLLEIGRYHRQELYDPYQTKPNPLTERRLRFEVSERIDDKGEVLTELDEDAVVEAAQSLDAAGIESVAVGYVNSYANPVHERRTKELLEAELDDCYVALSSDVSRKLGSIARFNSVIMNAALEPILGTYLDELHHKLTENGFDGAFFVVRSDGGVVGTGKARQQAETTILSGPAAGVKGGQIVGEATGQSNVIGMDMGGTSTDVSLVESGDPLLTTEYEVEFDIPLIQPMLDVSTIGAGGGSIAWIDQGGSLRVGPHSAGADPGPVCYDMGGTEPTITDANLVLGRLDPDNFLGGERVLNESAARDAIEELADRLDLDPIETAEGILSIANESMAAAVRETTIERGRDPREYFLVGFGGCGPMHAGEVASSLGIGTVIIPDSSGVLSALGGTKMDIRHTDDQTFFVPVDGVRPSAITDAFERLEAGLFDQFGDENIDPERVEIDRIAEMRYAGQTYEVDVPIPDGELRDEDIDILTERFHTIHETEYGVSNPDFDVTFVNLRVAGVAGIDSEEGLPTMLNEDSGDSKERREVYFDREWRETDIYRQEGLRANGTIQGPAIVEGDHMTVTIMPDMEATVDDYRNVLLSTTGESQ